MSVLADLMKKTISRGLRDQEQRYHIRILKTKRKIKEKQNLKKNRITDQVLWRHMGYHVFRIERWVDRDTIKVSSDDYQGRNKEIHRIRSYHLSRVRNDLTSVFDVSADVPMKALGRKDTKVNREMTRERSEVTVSETDRNDVIMMTIELSVRRWVTIDVKSNMFAFVGHCATETIRD